MKDKVVIIDYGSGNIKSLSNILSYLSCDHILSNKKEDLKDASKLLFPGQGHFFQAMKNLEHSGLIDTIYDVIKKGTPFLGICLGLQILFEKSEEAPDARGLSILKGEVKKFNIEQSKKIPQIGWNKIKTTDNNNYLDDNYYYFVNSYYICPDDKTIVSSYASYGIEFASSIEKDNILAVQFHPEKSADTGINFFKKWLKL